MKELDKPTLEFVRQLDRNQPLLAKHYRNLRVYMVWVGGDKQELSRWAKANKIANVGLGVIATDARNLHLWRISRKSISTTVLMRRSTPAACFIDLTPGQFDDIEEDIDEHFKKIRR